HQRVVRLCGVREWDGWLAVGGGTVEALLHEIEALVEPRQVDRHPPRHCQGCGSGAAGFIGSVCVPGRDPRESLPKASSAVPEAWEREHHSHETGRLVIAREQQRGADVRVLLLDADEPAG